MVPSVPLLLPKQHLHLAKQHKMWYRQRPQLQTKIAV